MVLAPLELCIADPVLDADEALLSTYILFHLHFQVLLGPVSGDVVLDPIVSSRRAGEHVPDGFCDTIRVEGSFETLLMNCIQVLKVCWTNMTI